MCLHLPRLSCLKSLLECPCFRLSFAMSHRTIHLFRKGLRLHDNPGLQGALASSAALFPVFVLDRALLEETTPVASTRWRFILQSLEDLDARLRALGSRLYVLRGSTATVLRDLVTRWSVTQISYDTEVEPHHARVEREIQALAEERGMQTHTCVSHTLYDVQRCAARRRFMSEEPRD